MTTQPPAPLSRAFLARALDRPVDGVTHARIGVDRGFAGTTLRLTVRSRDRGSTALVAKIGPDPMLEREVVFYRDLARQVGAPAPGCWYAGPAPDGTPVLLLEDLTGDRPGDALAGAGVDDVAAVLACMTPFWRHPATGPGMAALPSWGSDPESRQERFRARWASQRERLAGELPGDTWRLGERLCDSLATITAALRYAPASLLHADLHLDNVLFAPTGAGMPPRVLDWGSICRGPSAVDVFPFLAMSLSPPDHARHAAGLIADLGLGEAAIDDGRRRLLCYFAGVVGWRDRPPGAHPRERALCAAALADGRLVSAMRHWDAARVLPRPR